MKHSYIDITDQFCGAGGSSQGARRLAERVKGIEVKLAMNHWKLAIETHQTNFQNTTHDCTDISACDPRRYPSTQVLITSPECTNHTLAKGIKRVKSQMDLFDKGILDPAAERSRATMWDVPRFAEYHKYNLIIVENVVDLRVWVMYDAWIHAMDCLGYNYKCVYANSMFFHPTPQGRDRMYVVFWKKGNPSPDLDYRPVGYCHKCEKNINAIQRWKNQKASGKYKTQYYYSCPKCGQQVTPYYYAAFNCIDWSDIGKKIGDRKKPLSDKTNNRIQYGLDKYGNEPFLNLVYSPGVSKSLFDATGAITTSDHHALVSPFIINSKYTTGVDFRVTDSLDRLQTVTAEHALGICTPFIIKEEHKDSLSNCREVMHNLQTQTTRQSMALVTPFIVENKGKSKSRKITDPVGTCTTKPHLGVVTHESWKAFLSYNYNGVQTSGLNEATGTVAANDHLALVNYKKPKLEDCYYRMLKPHEIQLAMAFDNDYVILGSGKDKVKQCGNAVTPPVMEWLLEKGIETLK